MISKLGRYMDPLIRKNLSNFEVNSARSSFDIVRALTTKSDKANLLNKGTINETSNKADLLDKPSITGSDTEQNLAPMQKAVHPFKQEHDTSFRPEMSQGISDFWNQLQKVNPKFAKAVDRVQEVSPDTGSSVEEPNIDIKREDKFRQWSKPISRDEQKKLGGAERTIRRVLYQNPILSKLAVELYPHGSFGTGTAISSSDIDIDVNLQKPFVLDSQEARCFQKFRKLVGDALIHRFGNENVKEGTRTFTVYLDKYGVYADILASLKTTRYIYQKKKNYYIEGVKFYSKDGECIISRPKEMIANGARKHKYTGKRYKKAIRIFKRLRDQMRESDEKTIKNIYSALIEGLVYNVPNNAFGNEKITDDIKNILEYCICHTQSNEECKDWKEASQVRYVFSDTQKWSREQANDFLLAARDYIGFEGSRSFANPERLSEIQPRLEEQVEKVRTHIKNFNRYSRDNKEALSDALKALGLKQDSFKAMLEKARPYFKEIQYQLNAGEQNLDKLESYYQILQRAGQGFDLLQREVQKQRLMELQPRLQEQISKTKVHIANFSRYSRDNKEALSDALKAQCMSQEAFTTILGKTKRYCDQFHLQLKADEQNPYRLESCYQILQRANQGLDLLQREVQKQRLRELRSLLQEQIRQANKHIGNFSRRDNKEALLSTLKALHIDEHRFNAILEQGQLHCKTIEGQLSIGEQDLDKLSIYYQNLQGTNQGLNQIFEKVKQEES